MTRPRDASRLPAAISAVLTMGVLVLAGAVLFEFATVTGAAPASTVAPPPAAVPSPAALIAEPLATLAPIESSPVPPTAAAVASLEPSASPNPAASAGASPSATAPKKAPASIAAAPSATPKSTSTLSPAPTNGPFSIDLYHRGDFVSELTKVMCVPAAMQTSINIMSPGADTSAKKQQSLYSLARKLSPSTLKGTGAEPEGWVRGLTQLGFGPYVVDAEPTLASMIKTAAKALRLTNRPVGLLAWRGAHSWVMSGFTSTRDPALTNNFTVTAVYIEDVWYPRISSIWGASRPPDSLVPVGRLPKDLLPWRRPTGRYPGKDGKYVLVLPVKS
jgi:hypothetical protein